MPAYADPPTHAGPPITLTFDTMTGALIGSVDQDDFGIPDPPISMPKQTLSGHGLRIDSFWQDDSKTGEFVVYDSVTGRERQRIISIAQRPLQMSADGPSPWPSAEVCSAHARVPR